MTAVWFKRGGLNERLFRASWQFNQNFWFEDNEPPNITDVCQWFRVVVLWPLFHIGAIVASTVVFGLTLFYTFSQVGDPVILSAVLWSLLKTIVYIALIVASIVAFAFGVSYLRHVSRKKRERNGTFSPHEEPETPWPMVIWKFVYWGYKKVCLTIVYKDTLEEDRHHA